MKKVLILLYKFRYSKVLYFLPLIFILFLFIIGNFIYSLYPKTYIAVSFIGIIAAVLFYSTRKFMRHPIIYDEKNKTFYVLTSVFSEQYEDFTRSSIREIHITSKKIVIVLKDKSIVLSKYIENRDKLISFLKGESK